MSHISKQKSHQQIQNGKAHPEEKKSMDLYGLELRKPNTCMEKTLRTGNNIYWNGKKKKKNIYTIYLLYMWAMPRTGQSLGAIRRWLGTDSGGSSG